MCRPLNSRGLYGVLYLNLEYSLSTLAMLCVLMLCDLRDNSNNNKLQGLGAGPFLANDTSSTYVVYHVVAKCLS